jgi:hypothetical protein
MVTSAGLRRHCRKMTIHSRYRHVSAVPRSFAQPSFGAMFTYLALRATCALAGPVVRGPAFRAGDDQARTMNLLAATFHACAAFLAQLFLLASETIENPSASALHPRAELLDVVPAGTPACVLGPDRRGECCKNNSDQRNAV